MISGRELWGAEDDRPQAASYLNEIALCYPHAISFAAGAPDPAQYQGIELSEAIDRFLGHRCNDQPLDPRGMRALFEYGPAHGIIRPVVAERLRADGVRAEEEDIVVTVGVQEALLLCCRLWCATPADVVIVSDPGYLGIVDAASFLGIGVARVEAEQADERNWLDAIREACHDARASGGRPRLLYVTPDCANPTGSVLSDTGRRDLLRVASDLDLYIVEDSTYRFTLDDKPPTLMELDDGERVLHVGGYAKVGFPGARIGYVVAPQRVRTSAGTVVRAASLIARLKASVSLNTSPLAQAVMAGVMLLDPHREQRLGALYRRKLTVLTRSLTAVLGDDASGVTLHRSRGGFFLIADVPFRATLDHATLSAEKYGVLWMPLSLVSESSSAVGRVRLSCSYVAEAEIEEGAARFGAFVRGVEH